LLSILHYFNSALSIFLCCYIFLNIFLSHVISIFLNFTCQSPCLCSICHSWSYDRFIETNTNNYHIHYIALRTFKRI
jgi:hypothetical protein